LAETVGMTASATAARIGQKVSDSGSDRLLALAVVVAGGLVEGVALGVLQARVLAVRWPAVSRARFTALTVAVAGLGWAAASAPGVLGGDDGGKSPALALILLGAVGIGVVMGPVLGAAQAVALRPVVAHPWRWVTANAAAWPAAMAVIFLGASTAGAGWSTPAVAAYGAVTGVLAGAVLGLVSGAWLESLDGQPVVNRVVLELIDRRLLGADRGLVGLAIRSRRRGVLKFPVQYATYGTSLVVVPARHERKRWWRHLGEDSAAVAVLDGSGWHPAHARLLPEGTAENSAALAAYRHRWPRFVPDPDQPVVVLSGMLPGIGGASTRLESVV
jgi:hypothetical protein